MTGRRGCRARPGPVLEVEAFVREHPGAFRPGEVAPALGGGLAPSVVAEVVAYLLASGRAALGRDGRLVGPPSAASPDPDDPLSWMSANDLPDGVR